MKGLNQNFEMLGFHDAAASFQLPTSPATPKSQAKRQRKQCIYWDDFDEVAPVNNMATSDFDG